jgi:hypothetical protein
LGGVYPANLPKERAERPCRRARAGGPGRPTELKNTAERGLDLSALRDGVDATAPQTPGSPRFTGAIGGLYLRHAELQKDWR